MSLSTLRRSLFLSKSPLRLYDSRHLAPNSVRLSFSASSSSSSSSSSCSSCSSFRSSYLSSESHEYSLIYSDFENKKDQDGGSGPNGSFRSSHALLGEFASTTPRLKIAVLITVYLPVPQPKPQRHKPKCNERWSPCSTY